MRPLAPSAPTNRAAILLGLAALSLGVGAPALAAAPGEVRLHLALSERPHGTRAEREALRDVQYELAARLAAAGAGRVVGDAWPDGWCVVRIEAADAGAALEVARAVLRDFPPRAGSYAVVRRGGREEKVPLP